MYLLKQIKIRFSLKVLIVVFVAASVTFGWYSRQQSLYFAELSAVSVLQKEWGASTYYKEWNNSLPQTLDFAPVVESAPEWSWNNWNEGRLYRPTNYCALGKNLEKNCYVPFDELCVEALAKLRWLKFFSFRTVARKKAADIPFQQFERLEILEVSGISLSKNEIQALSQLSTLRSLDLSDAHLDDELIEPLLVNRNLERLFVFESPELTNTTLSRIGGHKRIQQLGLDGSRISDEGLKSLSSMKSLNTVMLIGTRVTGDGFKAMKGTPIRRLYLDDSEISDDGLKEIAVSFPQLERLTLSHANITDESVKVISRRLPGLQHLALTENRVTDKSIQYLEKLQSLEALELSGTLISEDGLERLVKSLECQITKNE